MNRFIARLLWERLGLLPYERFSSYLRETFQDHTRRVGPGDRKNLLLDRFDVCPEVH